MTRLASLALASSVMALLVTGVSAAPPLRAPALRSIDAFGAKLHAEVGKPAGKPAGKAGPPGNFVYSPASVAVALAMTREGARAQTAAEMDSVLGAQAGADARAMLKALAVPAGKPQPGMPTPPELS